MKLSADLRNPSYTRLIAWLGHLGSVQRASRPPQGFEPTCQGSEAAQDASNIPYTTRSSTAPQAKCNQTANTRAPWIHTLSDMIQCYRPQRTKTSGHALTTQRQHISSYITQGSQRHKYEIMRLNRIGLQTYCNFLLHAHSYQLEQDYSSHDQGPFCQDTCKYMTCLGIASDMQVSEKNTFFKIRV